MNICYCSALPGVRICNIRNYLRSRRDRRLMVGPFNLDTLINFVDPASILIVLGGTLAVVVACYPKLAKSFPKHFKIMLRLDAFNPEQYVEKLTELAQIARKNGLLALEEKAKEQEDPFFQQAIMLIVDANDPDRVRSILENDIEQTSERHQEVIAMYERAPTRPRPSV